MTPARYICDVAGVPVYEWTIRVNSERFTDPGDLSTTAVQEQTIRVRAEGPKPALRLAIEEVFGEDYPPAYRVYVAETRGVRDEAFGLNHGGPPDFVEHHYGAGWKHHKPSKKGTEIYRPAEASA